MNTGVIQLCHGGMWGTPCFYSIIVHDEPDPESAKIACGQLGFTNQSGSWDYDEAGRFYQLHREFPIFFNDSIINCNGSEILQDCFPSPVMTTGIPGKRDVSHSINKRTETFCDAVMNVQLNCTGKTV